MLDQEECDLFKYLRRLHDWVCKEDGRLLPFVEVLFHFARAYFFVFQLFLEAPFHSSGGLKVGDIANNETLFEQETRHHVDWNLKLSKWPSFFTLLWGCFSFGRLRKEGRLSGRGVELCENLDRWGMANVSLILRWSFGFEFMNTFFLCKLTFCMTSLLRPWNTLGGRNFLRTRQPSLQASRTPERCQREQRTGKKKENPGKHAWKPAKLGSSLTQYPTAHTNIQYTDDTASKWGLIEICFFVRLEILRRGLESRAWQSRSQATSLWVYIEPCHGLGWLDLRFLAWWESPTCSTHQKFSFGLAMFFPYLLLMVEVKQCVSQSCSWRALGSWSIQAYVLA